MIVEKSTISEYIKRFRESPPSDRKDRIELQPEFWWLNNKERNDFKNNKENIFKLNNENGYKENNENPFLSIVDNHLKDPNQWFVNDIKQETILNINHINNDINDNKNNILDEITDRNPSSSLSFLDIDNNHTFLLENPDETIQRLRQELGIININDINIKEITSDIPMIDLKNQNTYLYNIDIIPDTNDNSVIERNDKVDTLFNNIMIEHDEISHTLSTKDLSNLDNSSKNPSSQLFCEKNETVKEKIDINDPNHDNGKNHIDDDVIQSINEHADNNITDPYYIEKYDLNSNHLILQEEKDEILKKDDIEIVSILVESTIKNENENEKDFILSKESNDNESLGLPPLPPKRFIEKDKENGHSQKSKGILHHLNKTNESKVIEKDSIPIIYDDKIDKVDNIQNIKDDNSHEDNNDIMNDEMNSYFVDDNISKDQNNENVIDFGTKNKDEVDKELNVIPFSVNSLSTNDNIAQAVSKCSSNKDIIDDVNLIQKDINKNKLVDIPLYDNIIIDKNLIERYKNDPIVSYLVERIKICERNIETLNS